MHKRHNNILDNYFEIFSEKELNNNAITKLPSAKLGSGTEKIHFGGARLYNVLSLESQLTNDFEQFWCNLDASIS